MNKNLLGWRQYRGRIIPRSALEHSIEGYRPYDTRLKLGDKVRLRVDDRGTTQFLSSIIVDVSQSHRAGAMYALAFPATIQGELYIVVDGFSGTGVDLTDVESAEASGIYTEQEYEAYLDGRVMPEPVAEATRSLRLVASAIDEAMLATNSTVQYGGQFQ
jgi:hypothetical protein